MVKGYRSTRQRFLIDSSVGNFAKYFGRWFYGVTIDGIFNVPTSVREWKTEQTFIHRTEKSSTIGGNTEPEILGSLTGGILGGAVDLELLYYITHQTIKGNYVPLAIWGATNLASGIYELKRLKQTKKEILESRVQEDSE